jgi:hypothetical protein
VSQQLLEIVAVVAGCIVGWRLLELLSKRSFQGNITQPTLQAAEARTKALEQTAIALATAIGTYGTDMDVARARVAVAQAALQDPELRAGIRDPDATRGPNPLLDLAEYTLSI